MTNRVTSAGGIVYRIEAGTPLILMIADSQQRWSFPKGMVSRGETPEAAARREVQEETGIRGEILNLLGDTHYVFRQGGRLVNKTVYFYLIRASNETIVPQVSEITEARWFPLEEALKRSAFPANTALLRKAATLIEEGQEGRPHT